MTRRFTPVTFFIMGALLVWLLCFAVIYVLAALACSRGFAGLRMAGIGFVPAMSALLVIAGAVITALLARVAHRRWRRQERGSHARFIHFVLMSSALFVLLALGWIALPGLLVRPPCMGQPSLADSPSARTGIVPPAPARIPLRDVARQVAENASKLRRDHAIN